MPAVVLAKIRKNVSVQSFVLTGRALIPRKVSSGGTDCFIVYHSLSV